MIIRTLFLVAICATGPAVGDTPSLSNSIGPTEQDQFGCQIVPRPDHLTYSTFRDGWRSVAADKLYDLRRYEAVQSTQDCDCSVIRPAWSVIEDEYRALRFADGPSSAYDDWAETAYFPVISSLRDAVRELCGEAE